jgi:hypothetical protein
VVSKIQPGLIEAGIGNWYKAKLKDSRTRGEIK